MDNWLDRVMSYTWICEYCATWNDISRVKCRKCDKKSKQIVWGS